MRIRCYLPTDKWNSPAVSLSKREAHHLTRVLRATPGMSLSLFDGKGREGTAQVSLVHRDGVELAFREKHDVPPPPWDVTLGVAIPKQGKLDGIVDGATQLGAARILPLLTARGVVRISPQEFSKKQKRLAQIAIEAGKQSEVSWLPDVLPVERFEEVLSSFSAYDCVLIGAVRGPHERLTDLLVQPNIRRVLLLIGPEGDFTPGEMESSAKQGAHWISLGPTVLRCATAALCLLSTVLFVLREKPQR